MFAGQGSPTHVWVVSVHLIVEWKELIITRAHHMSLSSARLLQSIPPYPTSWSYILIFSCHLHPGLSSGLSPLGFPTKILYAPLHSPMCATCPAHLILDIITWIIFGKYRSLSSSLCSFLHSPVTLSHLDPHNLLSTLFLNTLSPCSSLNVSDQVSHPYKTKGKITFLYILIFIFLDTKLESRRFCTEWKQTFPVINPFLNSSLMGFRFARDVPKYMNSSTIQRLYYLPLSCNFVLHAGFETWPHTSFSQHLLPDQTPY